MIDYASTKGAIVSFTKALATHLIPQGIRVNAVAYVSILRHCLLDWNLQLTDHQMQTRCYLHPNSSRYTRRDADGGMGR